MRGSFFTSFYKSERQVLLLVVLVVILLGVIVWQQSQMNDGDAPLLPQDSAALDALSHQVANDSAAQLQAQYYSQPTTQTELFYFDPNTADSTALLRLGFRSWQVRNIYKYRAKGGRYHHVSDLKRLYGMTPELYQRLAPYVRIDTMYRYYATSKSEVTPRDTLKYPIKLTKGATVELNSADTTALKKIPGIGTAWAHYLIKYRDEMGGFVSLQQLSEISDLPQGVADWCRIDSTLVRRMAINKLPLKTLVRHPYLNFEQCKVIVAHRRKYGAIRSFRDLQLYEEFTPRDFKRLQPYVVF